MNTLLSLIPLLSFAILIPAIYGAFFKLSARILRYENVTWNRGFVFALIVMICSFLIRTGTIFIGYSMSYALGILLAVLINLLIGGWFFGKRCMKVDGVIIGWRGAIQLTGLSFIFLVITISILRGVSKMFLAGTIS